jgi:glycosyltransferase involved in cell wall biosynthesis
MSILDLSIVIPLFNEDESLPELTQWISRVMDREGYTYEIIFVNDGSTDNSWQVIQELRTENANVKAISFRRNQGKSAGLNQGFKAASGQVVITMDADLQDSPEEIPELRKMILEDGLRFGKWLEAEALRSADQDHSDEAFQCCDPPHIQDKAQ